MLRLGNMMAPAIFFLFKMALAIQGLCGSTQILEYFFFLFCEKCSWNFDRDCNSLS